MPIRFNIHNEDLQFNNYMFDVHIYIINEDEEDDEEEDEEEIKNINIKSEL